MFDVDTDQDWETFGSTEPYFSVLTCDRFKKANFTSDHREEFFRSGSQYVDQLLDTVHRHINPSFVPSTILDFGCGVGRVSMPLARKGQNVVGVDISESMLKEAKRNCELHEVSNVEFVKADDELSNVRGHFSLIHSFIVLQHIPVQRGQRIFERILQLLEPGGIGVIHFTYAKAYSSGATGLVDVIKRRVPFTRHLISLLRGRPLFVPQMQMNTYNMNVVLHRLQKSGVKDLHVEYTDHAGELGVILFFMKP